MKVSFDLSNEKTKKTSNIAFQANKFTKSPEGFREFEVSCPFDPDRDNCYLEVYRVNSDLDGNYIPAGKAYTRKKADKVQLRPGVNRIDLYNTFSIDANQPFAYHFVLENKHNGYLRTIVDAGDVIDQNKKIKDINQVFNLVIPTKSDLSRGGAMKLVIVDSQRVGWRYNDENKLYEDKALKQRGIDGIKTVTNKFGGTLAGLEYDIENGAFDPYRRIISLPLFTDDDFSAHAYWNKNCMQMASSLGNITNYSSFQRKMFAHGLNFVSDGAFVNEGLEGVHFKNMLKWGEDSPYFYWFKAGNLKDNPLSLGIFTKNKDFIASRIVNDPEDVDYNPQRPTYLQFYDKRVVKDEFLENKQELLRAEDMKPSTDNVYKMHTHNDSIYPYAFEINPEHYYKNLKILRDYNQRHPDKTIALDSYEAARILSKAQNYSVDGKFESGFETWDANPDIAKLNFVFSNNDVKAIKNLPMPLREKEEELIRRGNWQVQDYVVTSGKYWTQKTDDILRLYTAQNLKNIDTKNPSKVYKDILKIANNEILPRSIKAEVTKEEVENVLSGSYNHKRVLSYADKKSQILEGLMNTPLDSIEFGDNIVSVFASPLVSKRANVQSEVGVSRYELFKAGNPNLPKEYKKTYDMMDRIYTNEMYNSVVRILDKLDGNQPPERKLFDGNEVTEYGKYVLPLLLPEITKFMVINALAPEIREKYNKETGEISYDYKTLKDTHLETVGVKKSLNPQMETEQLLDKLQKGFHNDDSDSEKFLLLALNKTLEGTSLASFQLADLIIDKTQSGLDWRIDATKDIADIEAVRCNSQDFEKTWQAMIDFWKAFTQGVYSKNPNAYTVAEVTDAHDLHNMGYGGRSSKFTKYDDMFKKFYRETGMISTAHYDHYFHDIPRLFASRSEDGDTFGDNNYKQELIYRIFEAGPESYLRAGTLDSLIHSYVALGNHDKPRVLHYAAMDLKLFYANLNDKRNFEYRKRAFEIVENRFDPRNPIKDYEVNNYDFSAISPKAVAMADLLRPAFINVMNRYKNDNKLSELDYNKACSSISKAISDLAQGKFDGETFDPDAFGIKPIDVNIKMVLKQAREYHGLRLPSSVNNSYENDVFEKAMTPAMTKLLAMMKYIVALPGTPTLFDGDDKGATGFDEKTKNIYLQCRQKVHDEWVEEGSAYKEFIAKYKKYFDEVMAVRANPKCNALNNGAVHLLPLQTSQDGRLKIPAILRNSTDGRMAISLFNTSELHSDYRRNNQQHTVYLDKIYIDGDGVNCGIAGLRQGTKFVNANDENDVYYSRVGNDGKYYITRHCNGRDVPTMIEDSTLILYHVPEYNPALTFTGAYKPNAKFVANAYAKC